MKLFADGAVVPLITCLAACALLSEQSALAVEIIGHRGASHDAPENTPAAVKLAWKRDADAVEIDVHLTRDGQIVAIHDETTKRYGGPDKPVAGQTLAELQRLDVGTWKDPKWAGERIPTLAEILKTLPRGKRLFVEIKCGADIILPLKQALKAAGHKPQQTVFIGFSHDTMRAVKQALPRFEVAWVIDVKRNKQTQRRKPALKDIIRRCREANFDAVDLSYRYLDRDWVQTFHNAGLKCYVWTVNSPQEAKRLVNAGVDGITTDRPGWLKRQLANR